MLEKRLNGNQLKLIAVVAMVSDHIGYLLEKGTIIYLAASDPRYELCWMVGVFLRSVGRIAFPIFCFLLVEGFFHTRDWKKYAVRLGIFAVISEVPFDLMIEGEVPSFGAQNVFFTLLIGLLMMAAMNGILKRMPGQRGMLFSLAAVVAACGLAWLIRSDYDYTGIMLIALLYWFRDSRGYQCGLGYFWMALFADFWSDLIGLLFGFLPLLLYHGERGRLRTGTFFYWFYPLHMLALYGLYCLIG